MVVQAVGLYQLPFCRRPFIKGSLDEKLPSYELLKMLKVIDS